MPQIIDPKINVNPELGKKIAQIICAEIKSSLDGNAKRYELARRCENQYHQRTKWDIAGKVCDTPWENASNYFVGLSEWIVDAIWARLMNILFGQPDYMKAKGVTSDDIDKQEAVTDFSRMTLKEKVKLYENAGFFFKQIIKLPFAVLKFCWVQEYDSMITKEDALVFANPQTGEQQQILQDDPDMAVKQAQFAMAGMQPTGTQPVWVLQDEELINAPQLKYIRFEDYVYSPQAKRGQRLFWEGDRFWLTINEMMLKGQQERYIQDSVDKVRTQRRDAQKQGVEAIVADRETLIESFHWYGRLPFDKNNEIALDDPLAIEQEVVCDVAFKEEELLEINRWYYHRKPWPDRVYIRECYEETEEFEGRSILMKLYKTQTEINDLHKVISDNAWLAMMKVFAKKRSLTGEDWEEPVIFPGAFLEENTAGDIRVLDIGDVKAIGIEMEQQLLNFAERISNITSWNVGTQPQQPGGKTTATQFAGIIQEGNIGREPLLQRCYNVMKKICQWNHDYYSERMPEGLERRILGDNGEELFPTQENMAIYTQRGVNPTWRQDDVAGQFDWEWLGTSQNSDQQWNIMVANDLQDRYLQMPLVNGSLIFTWEILKEGLLARGRKDLIEKILPPKQAILQEMQKMAMEAQAKAQAGQVAGDQEAEQGKLGQRLDNANKAADIRGKLLKAGANQNGQAA
jgi:hypothetical protein